MYVVFFVCAFFLSEFCWICLDWIRFFFVSLDRARLCIVFSLINLCVCVCVFVRSMLFDFLNLAFAYIAYRD